MNLLLVPNTDTSDILYGDFREVNFDVCYLQNYLTKFSRTKFFWSSKSDDNSRLVFILTSLKVIAAISPFQKCYKYSCQLSRNDRDSPET